MKCNGCLKNTKDNCIKCSAETCAKSFCSQCIKLSTLSAEKIKVWKCPDCCATQKKGGDNSSTPIRPLDLNVTMRKKADNNTEVSVGSEVKELIGEVRHLTQEISSLKKQLEDATKSLVNCHTKLEELASSVDANNKRIKRLENRDEDMRLLESQVIELKQELNGQAQQHLRNEVELAGVPEQDNENLHHIALLAARKIGVELNDCDIDWVARVGPRIRSALSAERNITLPRPVVVRLLRRSKRDQILKASKSRRNITSTDLEVSGSSQKVFYNERLTKENRLLFRAARTKSKEKDYSFCWCSQGTIYVKQREGKPALAIRTHNDLLRIFNTPI